MVSGVWVRILFLPWNPIYFAVRACNAEALLVSNKGQWQNSHMCYIQEVYGLLVLSLLGGCTLFLSSWDSVRSWVTAWGGIVCYVLCILSTSSLETLHLHQRSDQAETDSCYLAACSSDHDKHWVWKGHIMWWKKKKMEDKITFSIPIMSYAFLLALNFLGGYEK